jgi:acyl transferase domain-containing protein
MNPTRPAPPDAIAATEPSLSPLKRAFLALEDARTRLAAAEGAAREAIAVIGMGCRVPGADGPEALWDLMRAGRDAIGPVPRGRFDIDAYFDSDPEAVGRIAVREAGFLEQVDGFDAAFFGISPREANGMDPQQRLLLEVSWEALEHAAQAPDRLRGSATGVFFGMCSAD